MSQTKVQLVSNIVGNVSGGASFTGIVTAPTVIVGSAVTISSSGITAGVITATSLSIGGATAITSPGVGIKTAGGTVGTGATLLDFRGAGISTVTVAAGIATINVTGGGGGAAVSISTVAPSSPANGDLWYDSSVGNTYIWYSSQNVWVVSQSYGY